ncbi:MAG: 16S rRNA (cytidine(1402)-2'-O)-methyltransferase [Mariprofundaceae bacterium]|nr:16S rRNA (cytidine(1402)-2'-O)-methyltransferase [Mariprofundaceae bacterium]
MDSQDNSIQTCGQLFIVATPIGNLADMTYRAIETLKNVDWIAAEDTRVSGRLLEYYDIKTAMFACHDHNEAKVAEVMLERLRAGESGALISDAGTPLINDPGYRLVRKIRKAGLNVIPIPGACSPIAALCASGLATDQFTYMGFLARSGRTRSTQLQAIADATHTCVFLESPKRILKTLQNMADVVGTKEICVGRELTKLYEEFVSGSASEVIGHFKEHTPRGEMVVMVGISQTPTEITDEMIVVEVKKGAYDALSPSARARAVAQKLDVKRSRVYAVLMAAL